MNCPKCHSNNVSVQAVNEVSSKTEHHSFIWWLCFGWYWVPIKWIVFTVPALIKAFFCGKKKKVVSKTVTKAVCQDCGHMWTVK